MAEEKKSPEAVVPPVAEETKPPVRVRSPFDKEALSLLATAESVGRAAQRPDCVGPLAERGIDAAFVATFLAETLAVQGKLATVLSLHGNKKNTTASEKSAKTALLHQIGDLHSAALQKWSGDPARKGDLTAYGIGQKLAVIARPGLETIVAGILARVAADALPGITPQKIAALETAFAAWKSADAAQTTHGTDAALLLAEAKAQLKDITDRRIKIQFAADGAFPHHNKDLVALRSEFKIPKNRPFRPVRN